MFFPFLFGVSMWRWRRGWRGGPGRPMKFRMLGIKPTQMMFGPIPPIQAEPIVMTMDEFEAYRLIYYLGLTQEEAARRMGVSRGTVWRCLDAARRKIARMLVEGRPLIITP